MRDASGTYRQSLAVSAVGLVASCAVFLLLPRYPQDRAIDPEPCGTGSRATWTNPRIGITQAIHRRTGSRRPSRRRAGAQPVATSSRSIIDVHAHFQSPALRPLDSGADDASGACRRIWNRWTAAGVTRSLLSVTTPGVPATGEQGAKLARDTNDYAAKLVADNRAKLGFFTCVPMDSPRSGTA